MTKSRADPGSLYRWISRQHTQGHSNGGFPVIRRNEWVGWSGGSRLMQKGWGWGENCVHFPNAVEFTGFVEWRDQETTNKWV